MNSIANRGKTAIFFSLVWLVFAVSAFSAPRFGSPPIAPAEPGQMPPPPAELKQLEQMMRAQMAGEAGSEPAGAPGSRLDLAGLKEKYQNCLVKIEFTLIANLQETKFNPTKSESYYSGDEPPHGTGFFINDSEILTNAHVVEESRMGSIRIKSPATGNVEFKADVVGIGGSEAIDLAILRLSQDELTRFKKRAGLTLIPHLEFGDSDTVKQADELAVFGYPESSDDLKIIQGKVTGRQYLRLGFDKFVCGHQFIEVGPAGVVQPGNSGGPALNSSGNVVGVPSRGSYNNSQGWLIPSNIVSRFLGQIHKSEKGLKALESPQLGFSLTENFAGTAVWTGADEDQVVFELGVVVREVIPGSLADKWGVKPNDVIVGFANRRTGLSCALDFEGYRVTTGRMKDWPPKQEASQPAQAKKSEEPTKLHLNELVMMSQPGDEVTLWMLRKGAPLQTIVKTVEFQPPLHLPHLGAFEKPSFELWGDFVAQDFTDYNRSLYEVPPAEVLKGGALVTFVEPNSLASRRGMEPISREPFGFAFLSEAPMTKWVIIDTVNGEPVKNLAGLQAALRKAEAAFDEKTKDPCYDPAKKIMMKERYAQIGFRTNTPEGRVLTLTPGFPIDDALECRSVLKQTAEGK